MSFCKVTKVTKATKVTKVTKVAKVAKVAKVTCYSADSLTLWSLGLLSFALPGHCSR